MKISKQLAQDIAKCLLDAKEKEYKKLQMEYRQYATEEYQKSVPKEVVEVYKKHPEYINTCRSLMANGHGFNYTHIEATEDVIQSRISSYNTIPLNNKNSEVLIKMKTKYEKALEKYKKLYKETEIALLTLATTKRIEENFPEAKPFLPTQSLLPSINLDGLRKEINS